MAKKKKSGAKPGERNIAVNRKARHDYHVEDSFEVGIALTGTEVKSLRAGQISFKDSYGSIDENGELWLVNAHIEEYLQGNRYNHNPERPRKLLMRRFEIERLQAQVRQQGYTLIPLRLYFKGPWVKVELGLCKGKKQYDQRRDIAERDAKRQIDQAMKRRR